MKPLSVLLESSCSQWSTYVPRKSCSNVCAPSRAAVCALTQKAAAPLELLSVLEGEQKEGATPCVPVELLCVYSKSSCPIIPMLGPLAFLVCIGIRHCREAFCLQQYGRPSYACVTIDATHLVFLTSISMIAMARNFITINHWFFHAWDFMTRRWVWINIKGWCFQLPYCFVVCAEVEVNCF